MNIVLFGNNQAAIYALQEIQRRENYRVWVVTPANKKVHGWHESLYDYAIKSGVQHVHSYADINQSDFADQMAEFKPDLFLSIYYDQIINENLLRLARIASINVHPSLLPKYRGTAPIIWAIVNGESETGVTFHYMESTVDSGAILMQRLVPISATDSGYDVHQKCNQLIARLLPEFFDCIDTGQLQSSMQSGESSFYKKSDAKLNCINWHKDDALRIYNIVRALARPLPGAFTYFRNRKCYLWKTGLCEQNGPGRFANPGMLVILDQDHLYVRTKSGLLQIMDIEVDCGRILTGSEFIREFRPVAQEYFCHQSVGQK